MQFIQEPQKQDFLVWKAVLGPLDLFLANSRAEIRKKMTLAWKFQVLATTYTSNLSKHVFFCCRDWL